MRKFRIGSHTADKTIIVESDSYEGLFTSAMEGLAYLLSGEDKSRENESEVIKKIKIESIDSSCLIVDFLSEVLSQSYINKVIFHKIKYDILSETELSATIKGNKIEEFEEDIKAITYFGANIKYDNSLYKVEILLDI
ncbi:MAG: archease [Candidatus Woesearchaeota archaeon]